MRLFSYFDAFQPLHRKDLIVEMIPLNQASQNEEDLSSPPFIYESSLLLQYKSNFELSLV